jgi:hypothetical protein
MTSPLRPISSLTVADCEQFRVWKFVGDAAPDETWVKPVKRLPVKDLGGKVVAVQVTLANGQTPWALLGNIVVERPELTKHFVSISVANGDRWFQLSRYFDHDYSERGPTQLARFLGLFVGQVFPIAFDVRELVRGNAEAAVGKILEEPETKLTRAEIIALSVG